MDVNSRNNVNIDAEFCNPQHKCVRSIKIGPGVRLKFCWNVDCKDEINPWTNAIVMIGPYNTGRLVDWADGYPSHVMLYPYNKITEPMVQLFRYPKFECGACGAFGAGTYDTNQIFENHIDRIWGLTVPEGVTALLYIDHSFRGKEARIEGPREIDLESNQEFREWGDNIRSIVVLKNA